MVVHHRLGHAGPFRQAAQGQGFGAFLAHQLPGDIEQLTQAIFTAKATAWGRGLMT
jgi:hypothetical protein